MGLYSGGRLRFGGLIFRRAYLGGGGGCLFSEFYGILKQIKAVTVYFLEDFFY